MSIRTVTAHQGRRVEPYSAHPGSRARYLKPECLMNTHCPVCGDEIVDARNAVLHDNADYPFEPTYFTHPECDSVTIGEAP
jgi:hypothetical protein